MGQHGPNDHKLDDGPEAELRGLNLLVILGMGFLCYFPLVSRLYVTISIRQMASRIKLQRCF